MTHRAAIWTWEKLRDRIEGAIKAAGEGMDIEVDHIDIWGESERVDIEFRGHTITVLGDEERGSI